MSNRGGEVDRFKSLKVDKGSPPLSTFKPINLKEKQVVAVSHTFSPYQLVNLPTNYLG
jgi:hypothetical protein